PVPGAPTLKSRGAPLPARRFAEKPAFATAAPPYPPMRAWEDEVGRPPHQVIRSQQMAPSRPARITLASTTERSTSPFPMVLATAVPNTNTAMKLNAAAQTTAAVGDSTRVDTTVT